VLEDKEFLWIDEARSSNMTLPPIAVMKKALCIAADVKIYLDILSFLAIATSI